MVHLHLLIICDTNNIKQNSEVSSVSQLNPQTLLLSPLDGSFIVSVVLASNH